MKQYTICNLDSCNRVIGRHGAKGYCPLHYRRYKLYGNPFYVKRRVNCLVNNCTNNKQTKVGYCLKHYKRYKKGKDPSALTIRDSRNSIDMEDHCLLPLGINNKDGFAIVDTEHKNLDKYFWSKSKNGYAQANINGKVTLLHHMVVGKPSKPLVTDHINRNKLDNRKVNLRFVTERENALNKRYASL